MAEVLQPLGYSVRATQARGCLHLKSAVTRAGQDCLAVNPDWIDAGVFAGWKVVEVDPREPYAANVLWLGDVTVAAEAHPRTRRRLESRGIKCCAIDMSELAKAEGALTCCSILLEA